MLPNRPGSRRAALAGIVCALVALLATAGLVQLSADRSWDGMQRRVRALQGEWQARVHRRTPLWGEACDQRAFDHYERAATAAAALYAARGRELLSLLTTPAERLATTAGDLRAAWQPVLADLRAGAHATDTQPKQSPYGPTGDRSPDLIATRWVANCAVFEAKALRHAGRHVEAVQHALDAATLAVDLTRDRILIDQAMGLALLAIALEPFDDASLAATPPAALGLLAAGLERLDRTLGERPDWTSELLATAYALEHTSDTEWLGGIGAPWSFGFSSRWMAAEAFRGYATLALDLGAADAPWPHRRALLELETAAVADGGNPAIAPFAHVVPSAEATRRAGVAELRLLRLAVDRHRGLDLPPLRDPLGDGPLLVVHEAGGVRLRSAGTAPPRRLERFVSR